MGNFGKSLSREFGKNTGKWVSNKVFGDGHSTPHRVKVQRSNSKSAGSKDSERSSSSGRSRSYDETAIEIAKINAEANDSDKVKFKRIEAKEKEKRMENLFLIIATILMITGYGVYYLKDYLSQPSCASVDDCIAKNDFLTARYHLGETHKFLQADDAIKIINAEVVFHLSENNYKAAYESATFINGVFFEFGDKNSKAQSEQFGRFIELIVNNAVLNNDPKTAELYRQMHPNPSKLKNIVNHD